MRSSSSKVKVVVLAILALVFWLACLTLASDAETLRIDGIRTEAEVTDVPSRLARSPRLEVQFTTVGGEVIRAKFENFLSDPWPSVGEEVPVIYDPENPRVVTDARLGPDRLAPFLAGAIAAAFTLGAVIQTRRLRILPTE